MPFKDLPEGQTHYENDGCGEPAHNSPMPQNISNWKVRKKKCSQCGVTKPAKDFYKRRKSYDGLHCYCKLCARKYFRTYYYAKREERLRDCHEYYKKNRDKVYQRTKEGIVRNPDKNLARIALRNAVYAGKIKQLPCEKCGNKRVHGHHFDYSKPLKVIWFCARHHGETHRKFDGVNPRKYYVNAVEGRV